MATTPTLVEDAPNANRIVGENTLRVVGGSKLLTSCWTWLQKFSTADPAVTEDAYLPSYILEGAACFGYYAAQHADLRALLGNAGNSIGKLGVNVAKLNRTLLFATDQGVFDSDCSGMTELVERMQDLLQENRESLKLRLRFADLVATADATAVPTVGSAYEFAMGFPMFFASSFESMHLTGELLLYVGARYTEAKRNSPVGDFMITAEAIGNSITTTHPHARTAASKLRLVESEMKSLQPDSALNIFDTGSDAFVTLSEKFRYRSLRPEQREDWVRTKLETIAFRFPHIALVMSATPKLADKYVHLKRLAGLRLKKAERTPAELLDALERSLTKAEAHVTYCLGKYKDEKLIESLSQKARDPSVTDDAKEEDGGGTASRVTTVTLAIGADDLTAMLSTSAFSAAADALAAMATETRDEAHANRVFKLISGDGLLICWQLLLRHSTLRRAHTFLNQLYTYKGALASRLGFCLTVGPAETRKGFAQTYKYDKGEIDLFVAGRHSEMALYKKGFLAVMMAVRKADSIEAGVEEGDWIYDGDHYTGIQDFLHRLTIGFGYALTPKDGISVKGFFEQLSLYRLATLDATEEEQVAMLGQLHKWFMQGLEESGPFLLQQLDEIAPAGKRLEGFLPPETLTSGVMHQIKEALKVLNEVDDFRRKASQLFPGRVVVIRGGAAASLKRAAPAEPGAGDDGAAGKKTKGGDPPPGTVLNAPKIGSKGKLVKFVPENSDFFTIMDLTYGPISELAQACSVGARSRCWPVMVSTKPAGHRCVMCIDPKAKGHDKADSGAHKPVKLPADFQDKYVRPTQDFVVPPLNEGPAVAAPASQ